MNLGLHVRHKCVWRVWNDAAHLVEALDACPLHHSYLLQLWGFSLFFEFLFDSFLSCLVVACSLDKVGFEGFLSAILYFRRSTIGLSDSNKDSLAPRPWLQRAHFGGGAVAIFCAFQASATGRPLLGRFKGFAAGYNAPTGKGTISCTCTVVIRG